MPRIILYAFSIILCSASSHAFAQGALTELYGEGVHRYFAGDLMGADQLFTQVIDSGSEDPRAYYFRGLVRARQGGGGTADFETGAMMEAEGNTAVNVGFALSRVQGHSRAAIEKARRNARVAARQLALAREQARIQAGGSVAPATAAEPAEAGDISEPAPADPFAGDEGLRSDATTVDPVQPTPPEVDAITNPFGDDPAVPTPDVPADDAPAGNPFGSPEPAADNPFGSPEPAADNPFGSPDPAADNPFGN